MQEINGWTIHETCATARSGFTMLGVTIEEPQAIREAFIRAEDQMTAAAINGQPASNSDTLAACTPEKGRGIVARMLLEGNPASICIMRPGRKPVPAEYTLEDFANQFHPAMIAMSLRPPA